MIDYSTAKRIVQDYLVREFPRQDIDKFVQDHETISTDYGWVLLCNEHPKSIAPISPIYLITWPVVVMKEDGSLHVIGSASRFDLVGIEPLLLEFEALELPPHFWKEEKRDTYLAIQLIKAVEQSDHAALDRLFDQGVSPNMAHPIGYTALIEAAIQKDISSIHLLLAHGAEVDLAWPTGVTALLMAANKASDNVVKVLLKAGASVHTRDCGNRTALHWAVTGEAPISMLRRLIKAGADVNATDNDGMTPLLEAASMFKLDWVKYLLKQRADITAQDRYGCTAMSYALAKRPGNKRDQLVKLLHQAGGLPGAPWETRFERSTTI